MNRLLPFNFDVIHGSVRTLVIADFLSRHPSDYEGSTIKAEEMFNSWFTIIVVNEIVPALNRNVTNKSEPIRIEKSEKVRNK